MNEIKKIKRKPIVCFRPMEEKDLKEVLEIRNREKIRNSMYHNHIISWREHYEWFKKTKQMNNVVNLVFLFKDNIIGVVNINDIDFTNGTSTWSIYRDDRNNVKGIGVEIGKEAVCYIFNKLKLRKIWVEVLGNNEVSIKFHKKLGFQVEGVFRKQVLRNNQFIDVFRLGLFQEDFI